MNNEPAIDMPAEYSFDALDGDELAVLLWPPGRRFLMHLDYEMNYELDAERRESLVVTTACDERLSYLHQYASAIRGRGYFVRDANDAQ